MERMRSFWPKSLSGLMLLGVALLAVPLLSAGVHAALQIQQLVDASRQAAVAGIGATRATEDLTAEILLQERSARLYQVLNDPKLLDSYQEHDRRLTTALRQLGAQLQSSAARQVLTQIQALQGEIDAPIFASQPTPQGVGAAAARFPDLSALAAHVTTLSNAEIDARMEQIQDRTSRSQHRLLLESALLIPLALAAALALALGIGRPLRQVDRAISELGQGNLSHPIGVRGPSDIVQLGTQLEWLRRRLLDYTEDRNRFLRHMSHELKTPLANIREGTDLLLDGAVGELDGNQREVAGILRENGLKLQRLIENLLSFSAWQNSSVGLETSEFRLRPLVKQVLENQQLTLLSQRVRLEVKVDDIILNADRGKMRLILDNLLSNAVKYSPKGGAIYLSAATEHGELLLDVADCGPGIAQEERTHIFDAFYTGTPARGSSLKGTGIGLSVVLEFVTAHGGSVSVIDGQFPGAHFRIHMPLAPRTQDSPGVNREQPHAA